MIRINIFSRKFYISAVFAFLLFFFGASTAIASEGTIEMRPTGNEPYRCYAVSIRMLDPEYRILFTCRFILYPADENIFYYVAWATPVEGQRDVRLGTIGVGRGEFLTKTRFKGLYVTTEEDKDPRTPSGRVVMRGDIEPIEFIEEVSDYEPTPTITINQEKEISPSSPKDSNETASEESTSGKIFSAFKRAGVAAIVAMIALAGLIFVITRSRG